MGGDPVVAALAAAATLCRPTPGVGQVSYTRGRFVHVLDASTCRDRVVAHAAAPQPTTVVRSPSGRVARIVGTPRSAAELIAVDGRRIFRETQRYKTIGPGDTPGPIVLFGWSGDSKWLFFTIDPGASMSIAADGLILRAIAATGGRVHTLGAMLAYADYQTWCGGRLVWSGGGDRLAVHDKRLLTAAPPDWRPRPLVPDRGRAWGSLTCTPDGRAVVVQSQPESNVANFWLANWSLWRIGLDGSEQRLTSPPVRYADDSPRYAGGTLLFVRSHKGYGVLRTQAGPLARLGFDPGYYDHHAWPYSVRR
jgi:hypothetical protein